MDFYSVISLLDKDESKQLIIIVDNEKDFLDGSNCCADDDKLWY